MRLHRLIPALAFATAFPPMAAADPQVETLIEKMTIEEKIGQLTQLTADMAATGPSVKDDYRERIRKGRVGSIFNAYTPAFTRDLQKIAIEQTRLKIPLLFGFDVIHGHRTIFPIPLAESSSWDIELIEKSARIAAAEAAADGVHWTFAPMADVSRDPRWGRVAEGAGEDPWLGSRIAEARVRGFQGNDLKNQRSVLACIKHLAAYGAPLGGRDYQVVDMSERELFETYFPPYEAAVRAGVGSAMSAFNEISGVPSTANSWLMNDILRGKWGFKGFVVSDYTSINELVPHGVADSDGEAGLLAFRAGVDMDMQGSVYANHLGAHLKKRKVSRADLDRAVRRVLSAKSRLGLFKDPYRGVNEKTARAILMSEEHLSAAREVARASIVLLKNEGGLLPLKKTARIALIGPLADNRRDQIGNWPAAGDGNEAVSPLEGLRSALGPGAKLNYALGANITDDKEMLAFLNQHAAEIKTDPRTPAALIEEAKRVAKKSDVIVLALGESQGMSGEAASRTKIRLPENQLALLRSMKETGKPIALLVFSGRPLVLEEESRLASALVQAWFLGTQAGPAIADVLFGDYNPSAKLTMSFPRSEGQIPVFYSQKNTGRPADPKNQGNKYVSRYLDSANEPLFPFGWGLSYTTFELSAPRLEKTKFKIGEAVKIRVNVRNTGPRDGSEVVQFYVRDLVASVTRPLMELRGFRKVRLRAGEAREVELTLKKVDFEFYDKAMKRTIEPGEFEVFTGGNSRDVSSVRFRFEP